MHGQVNSLSGYPERTYDCNNSPRPGFTEATPDDAFLTRELLVECVVKRSGWRRLQHSDFVKLVKRAKTGCEVQNSLRDRVDGADMRAEPRSGTGY
jgi:hypothetical protein